MTNFFRIIFRCVVVGVFLWAVLSYIEIVTHNLDTTEYIYSNWNFFILIIQKLPKLI